MRSPDLATSAAHIRDAFDELQIAWQDANELWHDEVARKFCESHLEPLGPVVKLSLDAMARMTQIVGGMHQDLSS
jgi:hypothetical protein